MIIEAKKQGRPKTKIVLPTDTKVCTLCKVEKVIMENFYLSAPNTNYYVSRCNVCCSKLKRDDIKNLTQEKKDYRKNITLKRKYNISLDDYYRMYNEQNGRCKICNKYEEIKEHKLKLIVDHCHTSGNTRELLCNNCNTTLGLIKENKNTLLNMIKYLDRHNQVTSSLVN